MARLALVAPLLWWSVSVSAPVFAQDPPSDARAYDAPAHISVVDGAAILERDGRSETAPASMPLLAGDRLRTQNGRVEVLFADGSTLHLDTGTRVDIVTDLSLSGPAAQYGRGMVADVSSQLIGRFADCLRAQLEASPQEAREAVERTQKPVSGLRLGIAALLRSVGRFFRRLFGRG